VHSTFPPCSVRPSASTGLFDLIDSYAEQSNGYPPYNIERSDETHYRITLAVAGFAEKDLDVEVRDGVLTVTGKREESEKTENTGFSLPGHRRARLRAALPARGACGSPQCQARKTACSTLIWSG